MEDAMAELIIHDQLAERLRGVAARENRSVEDVLSDLVDRYTDAHVKPSPDALAAMAGMFDDDVTDLSTTVDQTMRAYYNEK
jgi:plasmid stability protein